MKIRFLLDENLFKNREGKRKQKANCLNQDLQNLPDLQDKVKTIHG
ncbi:hypothetical protein BGP_2078 [Beggiatoa sp. PS]|nr:hypothetical protein BGP_2078 [Beggiatoa sp. PS]